MNEKINNSIKLLCILCICFLILALFYYINKYNETFTTPPTTLIEVKQLTSDMFTEIYKTPLECIDHLKIQALNLKDDPDVSSPEAKTHLYKLDIQAKEFCETKCKPSNCVWKDLEETTPDYIKTLHKRVIKDKDKEGNNILLLSWLRPDSEHPILKYTCVIETDNDSPVRVELPVITNNDIIEHTISDLDQQINYTIKVFSENKYGLSKPAILYNINLSTPDEDNNEEDSINLKEILSQILMNTTDIKIDTTELQKKYNIKKQLILTYLLQNSSKLNDLSNNKNIKII